jgi:lipid-A-disaccharide synthase
MTVSRKIFVSAGETSGDIHAAGLISELTKIHKDIELTGLGGDNLRQIGTELLYHCRDLAMLGFWEVITRLKFFIDVKNEVTRHLRENRPDLVLLVDYPGMNLKIAEEAYKLNIPVVYFILPQVWAWNARRVFALRKFCDLMISILPFEVDFFKQYDIQIEYVGHPLIDVTPLPRSPEEPRFFLEIPKNKPMIALLPGSRRQEIDRNLKVMIDAFEQLSDQSEDLMGVILKAPNLERQEYTQVIGEIPEQVILTDQHKYEYLQAADCAVVASGTATLEAALCQTPSVVIYRTSWLTYLLARMLVKIDMIALANLVAGEKVFPEMIQSEARPDQIAYELRRYLEDDGYRSSIREKLIGVRDNLKPSKAYKRAAELISERFLRV